MEKKEFDVIRGSIAWPYRSKPGLVLLGGLNRETKRVTVLEEKEYKVLSELLGVLEEFREHEKRFRDPDFVSIFCYQDIPENQVFVEHVEVSSQSDYYLLRRAPNTDNIDFGIPLINDYIQTDRLSIPSGGIIENQIHADWEGFSQDEMYSLHGIIALFVLLNSFDVDHGFMFPQFRRWDK